MIQVTKKFLAEGMVCEGCETVIQKAVSGLPGIEEMHADYASEEVEIRFDPRLTSLMEIFRAIDAKGYTCVPAPRPREAGPLKRILVIVGGLAIIGLILYLDTRLMNEGRLPRLSPDMSHGLLFLVGLFTGFHCVGMCGGFVVGYTAGNAVKGVRSYFSHFLYGLGKTLSYGGIGALFGLLGAFVAFTPFLRGVAAGLAGLFLILYGLKMLNWVPRLRRFGLHTPASLARFTRERGAKHSHPFVIGLLNGLMIACGPLQAMYVMAAGTGSAVEGATLLLFFGLGTLPVLFGFGMAASFISSHATHALLKSSGLIVMVLGAIMINRGLILTGSAYDFHTLMVRLGSKAVMIGEKVGEWRRESDYQEIKMVVTAAGYEPDTFVLIKDVPVHWVIDARELTGCNRAIMVPSLDLEFELEAGEQVIEFTPRQEGVIPWSCWMGMIAGSFIVQEDSAPETP